MLCCIGYRATVRTDVTGVIDILADDVVKCHSKFSPMYVCDLELKGLQGFFRRLVSNAVAVCIISQLYNISIPVCLLLLVIWCDCLIEPVWRSGIASFVT